MLTRTRIARMPAMLAAAVLALGTTGTARAGLVATDLNTGGTDVGFSGGWAGSANVTIQPLPDLTYANYYITQSGTEDKIFFQCRSRPAEDTLSGLGHE